MLTRTTYARWSSRLSLLAVVAIAAASCSTPESQVPATTAAPASATESQPPAAAAAEAPSQSQPAANPAPSAALQPAPQPTAAPPPPPEPPAAPAPRAAPAPPPAPPKPKVARLSAGDPLTIRTTRALSTKTMKTGDVFSAVLEEPITVEGWVAVPVGARLDGRIAAADDGGRIKGKANLSLELTSLTTGDGRKIEIVTSPVNSEAAADKRKDAKRVGIGAGGGAAVGAIAGGGKGAAIGALVGAGAGAAMKGGAAEIPAESVITFELRSPVTIEEKK